MRDFCTYVVLLLTMLTQSKLMTRQSQNQVPTQSLSYTPFIFFWMCHMTELLSITAIHKICEPHVGYK